MGTKTLEAEPALNHISGGSSPTFTVMVENDGEFPETDVKVDLNVTAGGKQLKASHVIDSTEPEKDRQRRNPRLRDSARTWPRRSKSRSNRCPAKPTTKATKGTFLGIFE